MRLYTFFCVRGYQETYTAAVFALHNQEIIKLSKLTHKSSRAETALETTQQFVHWGEIEREREVDGRIYSKLIFAIEF